MGCASSSEAKDASPRPASGEGRSQRQLSGRTADRPAEYVVYGEQGDEMVGQEPASAIIDLLDLDLPPPTAGAGVPANQPYNPLHHHPAAVNNCAGATSPHHGTSGRVRGRSFGTNSVTSSSGHPPYLGAMVLAEHERALAMGGSLSDSVSSGAGLTPQMSFSRNTNPASSSVNHNIDVSRPSTAGGGASAAATAKAKRSQRIQQWLGTLPGSNADITAIVLPDEYPEEVDEAGDYDILDEVSLQSSNPGEASLPPSLTALQTSMTSGTNLRRSLDTADTPVEAFPFRHGAGGTAGDTTPSILAAARRRRRAGSNPSAVSDDPPTATSTPPGGKDAAKGSPYTTPTQGQLNNDLSHSLSGNGGPAATALPQGFGTIDPLFLVLDEEPPQEHTPAVASPLATSTGAAGASASSSLGAANSTTNGPLAPPVLARRPSRSNLIADVPQTEDMMDYFATSQGPPAGEGPLTATRRYQPSTPSIDRRSSSDARRSQDGAVALHLSVTTPGVTAGGPTTSATSVLTCAGGTDSCELLPGQVSLHAEDEADTTVE